MLPPPPKRLFVFLVGGILILLAMLRSIQFLLQCCRGGVIGLHLQLLTRAIGITKENNFKQPGERYRSWPLDRQERFINRWVAALSDPCLTHEIRSIWISYWSQADKSLGQKLVSRLSVRPTM